MYNTVTGALRHRLPCSTGGPLSCLHFEDDGELLLGLCTTGHIQAFNPCLCPSAPSWLNPPWPQSAALAQEGGPIQQAAPTEGPQGGIRRPPKWEAAAGLMGGAGARAGRGRPGRGRGRERSGVGSA